MNHLGRGKIRHAISALLLVAALLVQPLGQAQEGDWKWEKRDTWERPEQVMDALGMKPGSVVADVGCGDGYFTFHLASRVGPQGKVYAEDIDYKVLSKINGRAFKEHLSQIELILGSAEDPRLPSAALDAILVVEAYHEMKKYDAMLQGMNHALKPGGWLGIIDRNARPRRPRSTYQDQHRIPKELVREDATRNGFRFIRQERGFKTPKGKRKYYFLVFQKT